VATPMEAEATVDGGASRCWLRTLEIGIRLGQWEWRQLCEPCDLFPRPHFLFILHSTTGPTNLERLDAPDQGIGSRPSLTVGPG
jgi:hypothetical protein